MKFQNISKKTKHIKVNKKWLVIEPQAVFEIPKPGRLHLDPELKQIVEEKKGKKDLETLEDEPVEEEEKEMVDVSDLDEKSKERVEDLKEDLKDDGKRNHSHKKKKRGLFSRKK